MAFRVNCDIEHGRTDSGEGYVLFSPYVSGLPTKVVTTLKGPDLDSTITFNRIKSDGTEAEYDIKRSLISFGNPYDEFVPEKVGLTVTVYRESVRGECFSSWLGLKNKRSWRKDGTYTYEVKAYDGATLADSYQYSFKVLGNASGPVVGPTPTATNTSTPTPTPTKTATPTPTPTNTPDLTRKDAEFIIHSGGQVHRAWLHIDKSPDHKGG
ncbi:MAG: hypothetical protein HC888_02990 [Candidatus Competibacteraceae bacterium]|nr:hypothetical protein [Candidatus Competibacteraceae bacterium]